MSPGVGLAAIALLATVTQAVSVRAEWAGVPGSRIHARIFQAADVKPSPVLVVVLHGDAPFNNPTYQYAFAKKVVERFPRVIAAALLRPGYADTVNRSDGIRGTATGDNYTPEVLHALNASIIQLKSEVRPLTVVLVGHSGGSVLSADLMEIYPGLATAALLVSCPCDVSAWRKHMQSVSPSPLWTVPVRSISPMDHAGSIREGARIAMVVGEKDPIAPEIFTDNYALLLKKRGIEVAVTKIPGAGHEILSNEVVLRELAKLISPR